ncbi:MAG: hypothetical protein AMXMBFR49_19030 [Chlorobiota bacterium]
MSSGLRADIPVVVTFRAYEEGEDTLQLLKKHGFEGRNIPLIMIDPVYDDASFSAFSRLDDFDILVLTSVHALNASVDTMEKLEQSFEKHPGLKLACVGEKTAKKALEYFTDNELIIPDTYSAEGLTKLFEKSGINGKKILLPVSNLSKESFAHDLVRLGAKVERVVIYRTDPPPVESWPLIRSELDLTVPDFLVFTSPSTFKNFIRVFGEEAKMVFDQCYVCAIGDITKKAIEDLGYHVFMTPEIYTLDSLLTELKKYTLENSY